MTRWRFARRDRLLEIIAGLEAERDALLARLEKIEATRLPAPDGFVARPGLRTATGVAWEMLGAALNTERKPEVKP